MSKKNRVTKSRSDDKVARVLREFKDGKLKGKDGKTITDKNQAIAIALSEAGLSNKDMQKAEMMNKARVFKAQIEAEIKKEMNADGKIRSEIISYFKNNPNPIDSDVHAIAERNGIEPDKIEGYIYKLLSNLMATRGKQNEPDAKELETGIKTEMEHTTDKEIAEKIARDHLNEAPDYNSKLTSAGL